MAEGGNKALEPSNEMVRWLRMLALPLWARIAVSLLLTAVILAALGLFGWALWTHQPESASSSIGLLTIALPVMLVVIALVFGQNSDRRLRELTTALLQTGIPRAIHTNFGEAFGISVRTVVRGCCADYEVWAVPAQGTKAPALRFTVELNVFKVNVCYWLPGSLPGRISAESPELGAFRHVILGAIAEGYALNEEPARYQDAAPQGGAGLLFFRRMVDDFLLLPGQQLYFAQDLSFFVRGMLEALLQQRTERAA
ncbi:hypothetical protein ACPWT1_07095 [Ramlibacter sp. MMS24-I3-19]|uniref:hypothetical protein n=1 Tax=Ramlibacter sp. MMS24-I3-19 TaxID=3416606 RepID=UPI003CFD337F